MPRNANVPPDVETLQSYWRGLTEAVSIAALLHDLGHVPFGHTLEDEFSGLYKRHDDLAGPRLYCMLFDSASELAAVFNISEPWIGELPNETLRRLIYVTLNWKEDIDQRFGFDRLLQNEIENKGKASKSTRDPEGAKPSLERLTLLSKWHSDFVRDKLFSPFMSDIIGNTICSDLLDYLPRDRTYLGMEARHHGRLQRYFTIKEGTLYRDEGMRMSIMVTRGEHGGQRRDVATGVLDIMRERYEMAERVYYHHKKAAASAMLAKLVELMPSDKRPREDEKIYPAPWQGLQVQPDGPPPHMTHLSDSGLIEYLGSHVRLDAEHSELQRHLYLGLVSRRQDIYRTLLVVDRELANAGKHPMSFMAEDLRGTKDKADSARRLDLERKLSELADGKEGDVIIYCPSPSMQSKEVDARLEIAVDRVLPLRVQDELFTYHQEVELLKHYYTELWRAYVFVTPAIFSNKIRSKKVVNAFCDHYELPREAAYAKVRDHRLRVDEPTEQPAEIAETSPAHEDSEYLTRFTATCKLHLTKDYSKHERALMSWYEVNRPRLHNENMDKFITELERSVVGTPPGGKERSYSDIRTLVSFLDELIVKYGYV
jgi:hypothetical protein